MCYVNVYDPKGTFHLHFFHHSKSVVIGNGALCPLSHWTTLLGLSFSRKQEPSGKLCRRRVEKLSGRQNIVCPLFFLWGMTRYAIQASRNGEWRFRETNSIKIGVISRKWFGAIIGTSDTLAWNVRWQGSSARSISITWVAYPARVGGAWHITEEGTSLTTLTRMCWKVDSTRKAIADPDEANSQSTIRFYTLWQKWFKQTGS